MRRISPIWIAIVVGIPGSVSLAAPADTCNGSAVAQVTLAKLDEARRADTTPLADRQSQIAILRQALVTNPQDLTLHTTLQDLEFANTRRREVIAHYESLKPRTPLADFLTARSLISVQTPLAIPLLRSSKFPQAHLLLAEIYSSTAFRDLTKVRQHWNSFRTACPATPAWWGSVTFLPDVELRGEITSALRKTLGERSDLSALRGWGKLWQTEIAATRSDQRSATVAQIRGDYARLANAVTAKGRAWVALAEQASSALEDQSFEQAAWTELAASHPQSIYPAQLSRQNFFHQFKIWGTPQAVAAAKEIADRWPGDIQSAFLYWRTIQQWNSAPREQAQQAVDRLKALLDRDPGAIRTSPPPQTPLAEFIVARGLRLDDVPPLVFQTLALAEQELAGNDLFAKPAADQISLKDIWHLLSYFPLAESYIGMKRVASASDIVSQIKRILDRTRPAEAASGNEKFTHAEQEAMYWFLDARLHELADRKDAAIAAYQRSLKTFPPRRPRADRREEVMLAARKLWRSLDKDEAAWNDWAAAALVNFNAGASGANGWKVLASKRPGFKFRDVLGKEWDPAELASKTTLVAYWATWCLPCREELPYLEKLTVRLAGRPDVAVLALNVDEDPSRMAPFLAQLGVKLHSVAARDFGYELAPVMALPSNWIMRPEKTEPFYVEASGEAWIEKAIEALRRLE